MPKINLTRRQFLKASGASLFLAGTPLAGFTKDKPPGTISVILLEGGMDGLAAVPPFGDPNLSKRTKRDPNLSNPTHTIFESQARLAKIESEARERAEAEVSALK